MNRLRAIVAAAAVVPLALSTIAADSANGCVTEELETRSKTVCTERVYFHCTDDTIKVANLTSLTGAPPSFDPTAPDQSVQEGAGCGALDTPLTGTSDDNPIYDAPFAGYWVPAEKSDLDTLTIRMHVIDAGLARADDGFVFGAHLRVNGEELISRDSEFEVVPIPSETGISREIVLTVEDIGLEDIEAAQVNLTLYSIYFDTNTNAWVWDTTEVPSGIDFNPATSEGHVIQARSH